MNPDTQIVQNESVNFVLETLNIRERRYVLQATIGRMSQSEAANDAGFANPPKGLAVTNAINVLQHEMAKELNIDFNHVTRGLQDAIEIARSKGDAMPMISGYKEQGKLAGLYIEKKQIDVNIRHISEEDLSTLSEDELNELIDQAEAIELGPTEYERLPEPVSK